MALEISKPIIEIEVNFEDIPRIFSLRLITKLKS